MARWDELDSKRFALWLLVIAAPVMLAVELLEPRASLWWHYFALALYGFLFANAAYRLVTERVPHA